MNNLKAIRERLGVTQTVLADELCCTQGNIGHIENGLQELKPFLAQRLIDFAAKRGHTVTFDDVYSMRSGLVPAAAPTPAATPATATA